MNQPAKNFEDIVNNEEEIKYDGEDKTLLDLENRDEIEATAEQVEEILNSGDPHNKKRAIMQIITQIYRKTSHSGPLPDGDTIAKYNQYIPDGGNRVMLMAEKQQVHRHYMDKTLIQSYNKSNSTGQWMGFCLAIIFLFVAAFLIIKNHEGAGITIMTLDIIGLVSIFVLGKYQNRKVTSIE